MESLFRFTVIRPAIAQDPARPSIQTAQDSQFQMALAEAASTENPREALREVAQEYTTGNDFIGDPDTNPQGVQLDKLASLLEQMEGQPAITHQDVVDVVIQAFGSDPSSLVQSQLFNTSIARLRDSILAIKQLQEAQRQPIEALAKQLRDLELIIKLAQDEVFPSSTTELRLFRRRSLLLPTSLDLQSTLSTAELEEERRMEMEEAEAEIRQQAEVEFEKYRSLTAAVKELTELDRKHFNSTHQEPLDGFNVPQELSPHSVATLKREYLQALAELNTQQLRFAIDGDNDVDPLKIQDLAGASSATDLAEKVLNYNPTPVVGSLPFEPVPLSEFSFRLKESAYEVLSETTQVLLDERNLMVTEHPLDGIVENLQNEIAATSRKLDVYYSQPDQRTIKRFGDTFVIVTTPHTSHWARDRLGPDVGTLPPLEPVDERIPRTRGQVIPSGVADLMIVKQQLIGYETADVAHIENVLKGENKERRHTRRRETEQFIFSESELSITEERDLESTDRFEMTRETSTTIEEDASLIAGLTVSGKYGPSVEFSASAAGSVSRTKEEVTAASSNFSQDITERSATRISERILEQESLRVTNEVFEENYHVLNNVGEGVDGHISGVYQWVNKVYQAQMFNYGLRMMFDFMVPEPAVFLIEAMRQPQARAIELRKPPEFTLKPEEITIEEYGSLVKEYGVTDVVPPPEMYITKSHHYHAGGNDGDHFHSAEIPIDQGYKAIEGSVGRVNNFRAEEHFVGVVLGRKFHCFSKDSGQVWTTGLDEERDSIPFALTTAYVSEIAVAVEIKCLRTCQAFEKWQLDTHAKLTTAYKASLSEYEEKLASLELEEGVEIQGNNPASNLETMKHELKKNCVSILTDQHYDLFNAIVRGRHDVPEINLPEAEAEGTYVRFFEQAFEWENMTWLTYPYFWGRKRQWIERLAFEDTDPLFDQFLKAGYCRVSVPARQGFEGAIDHFMTYGELWNGGPLPPISSPLYLPIADEIAERIDQPGFEIPQGDPWLVRIPTTLVKLRVDDRLPQWVEDADGNWKEV